MSEKKSLQVLYLGRDEAYARLVIPDLFPGFEVTVTIGVYATEAANFDAVFVDVDEPVTRQNWLMGVRSAVEQELPVWIVFDPKTVSDLGELILIGCSLGAHHFTPKCPTD